MGNALFYTKEDDCLAKKHIHKLIINQSLARYKHKFKYNFGHTKDIVIEISKERICITAMLNKMYDKNEMLSSGVYLFPDAIKKALLIHLVLFSENINIKSISVQIDDEIETVVFEKNNNTMPIYSLVANKLSRPLSTGWDNNKIITALLNTVKSNYDSRTASLFALLNAKNKVYETEKFIYLWMSFNGMYNYFFKKVVEEQKDKNPINQEWHQIILFQQLYNWGKGTVDTDNDTRIVRVVDAIIKDTDVFEIPIDDIVSNKCELSNKIHQILFKKEHTERYNLTPYGYLLTQYSYYYRCNIIHADKPLKLFSYADENEIRCLKFINMLLEDFLDKNLHLWFDDKYIRDVVIQTAKKVEIRKERKKKK